MDALGIKVYAKGSDNVEIRGVIPLELALPATARTSACLPSFTYGWPYGEIYIYYEVQPFCPSDVIYYRITSSLVRETRGRRGVL